MPDTSPRSPSADRVDGRKELVALAEGYRESTQSWADLLRDGKRGGMRAPVLAAGDGAVGQRTPSVALVRAGARFEHGKLVERPPSLAALDGNAA